MRIADAKPYAVVFLREPMDERQMRETFYLRLPDGPCRYPKNVRIARLRCIQGEVEENKPTDRLRFDSGWIFCTDPGEIPGALPVENIWNSIFMMEYPDISTLRKILDENNDQGMGEDLSCMQGQREGQK